MTLETIIVDFDGLKTLDAEMLKRCGRIFTKEHEEGLRERFNRYHPDGKREIADGDLGLSVDEMANILDRHGIKYELGELKETYLDW